jgi:ABC-2 type transport system ATP-binding protein
VWRGEVFALLGPNGAGKTTTLEILEGYRKPDAGSVRVLGLDPVVQAGELKARVGVMLQGGGLYPAITAREALTLFATFFPHPRSADALLGEVGLQDSANTQYRRLSGGQKQRLALAVALVGNPDVVFLDEPTAGLDPQARRVTWEIIARLQEQEVTVLLTTHYLEEAERLANRVAIIGSGRLIASGSPASLIRQDASVVHLRTVEPIESAALRSLPSASEVRQDEAGGLLIETTDAPSFLVEATTLLRELGLHATELRVGHGSLEDVFLELTRTEGQE